VKVQPMQKKCENSRRVS